MDIDQIRIHRSLGAIEIIIYDDALSSANDQSLKINRRYPLFLARLMLTAINGYHTVS